MDYENDKDAEDAMEALKGKNMGGRSLNIGKLTLFKSCTRFSCFVDFIEWSKQSDHFDGKKRDRPRE